MNSFNTLKAFSIGSLLSAISLAGCGGGNTPPAASLAVACSGANCGAESTRYTGSGLGVWAYKNDTATTTSLPISLTGLKNNKVTLVFSNTTDKPQAMPSQFSINSTIPAQLPPFTPYKYSAPQDTSASLRVPNETRSWKVVTGTDAENKSIIANSPSTLRSQLSLAGFNYKIWVADQEWTPLMQKNISRIASLLFGTPTYPGILKQYVDDYATPAWGSYPNTTDNAALISPESRDINIIFSPSFGDFFNSTDVYKTQEGNAALAVFIHSSGFSCINTPEGMCIDLDDAQYMVPIAINLMLHELTHLTHFYPRVAKPGKDREFERWLKESIASSQGYIVSMSRFPNLPTVPSEPASWLNQQYYACSLNFNGGEMGTPINQKCSQNYYKSGQAFLIFLVHQYGTGIYREFLKAKGTGIDAVDEAIRASGGTGFEDAFRRWGSMLAFPDAKALPAGYGYPGVRVGDYTSPAWNGADIAKYFSFPTTLPDTIAPYSHLPLVEHNQTGQYVRDVKVPPGVTLSIYIQ